MANVYYLEPAVGNDGNAGDDWGVGNSWATLQHAADTATVGDIVYCKGTETISAQVDFDTNAGTNTGGYIKFIGVNGSGVRDGTRYIVDANSNDCDGIVPTSAADLVWLENIEVKNCGGTSQHGFYFPANPYGFMMINCCSNNNSGCGYANAPGSWGYMIRCCAYSNTHRGIYIPGSYSKILFSAFHDNTLEGLIAGSGNTIFIGCISYDNADGFEHPYQNNFFLNCIFEGNTGFGIQADPSIQLYAPMAVGCRFTNNGAAGLDCNSEIFHTLSCYFEDNDSPTDNIQNDTLHENISSDGTANSSNDEEQGDTNEGYTNKVDGTEDLNLRSDATLRRQAITIPTS